MQVCIVARSFGLAPAICIALLAMPTFAKMIKADVSCSKGSILGSVSSAPAIDIE